MHPTLKELQQKFSDNLSRIDQNFCELLKYLNENPIPEEPEIITETDKILEDITSEPEPQDTKEVSAEQVRNLINHFIEVDGCLKAFVDCLATFYAEKIDDLSETQLNEFYKKIQKIAMDFDPGKYKQFLDDLKKEQ